MDCTTGCKAGNEVCVSELSAVTPDGEVGIRFDRTLCMARVNVTANGKTESIIVCDYASAASKELDDVKYFTIHM